MSAKTKSIAHWISFDVSYTAAQLARFCASAGVSHWAALHHLMGYLEHNPSFKLTYREGHSSGLDGYADSDWGNSASRRSTTGILARYNKQIVLWRSKLQKTISLSTAEAEYYAASEMAIEMIYLRNLLHNMGFKPDDDTPVYEDNNGETTLSADANVLSTSTSASILLMRRFRMDTCDSSKSEPTTKGHVLTKA